jgi:hypothetical protein
MLKYTILILKTTRCTNFSNLFWNETLHVSDSSSVHYQEFFTVHTAMVYVIQICRQLVSRLRMELVPSWSYSKAVYKTLSHIPLLYVQWKSPDDGQRNCTKYVEFHSKNKFEKFVHLVGFIIRKIFTMHSHMDVKKGIIHYRLRILRQGRWLKRCLSPATSRFLPQYQRVIKYRRLLVVWSSRKRVRRPAYCVCGILRDEDKDW